MVYTSSKIFDGAGLLAIDEVYSGEKLVIDYKVVQYVKNLVEGFRFSDEYLSIDIIKEVGIGGEFVSHDSTLKDFRDAVWGPNVFEHIMLRKWRQMGEPELRDKLRAIAKERIKKHSYNLPEDISKELHKIYNRAKEEFGG